MNNGVIITGCSGIIGTALIDFFSKKGRPVTAVIRPGSARRKMILPSENIRLMECPLENIGELPSILTGQYDGFYHLGWADTDRAGRNDPEKQEKNIKYTMDALKAAAQLGCKVFIGAGSQAEYGRFDRPISENFAPRPETAYGKAKLEAGKLSAEASEKLGIKHVWTRIFSAYGPNDQSSTMIMYCIGKLLKKERVSLTACTQTWDFIYCSDAAKAMALAAEKGLNKGVYNIGSGIGRKLREYVMIIKDMTGVAGDIGFGDIKAPEGGLIDLTADIMSLKHDTGFLPEMRFEEGIKKTIEWYKENYL
jgi:nucleoside-diphosphate-sugar epimerase